MDHADQLPSSVTLIEHIKAQCEFMLIGEQIGSLVW